jgi:hypothetical protein
MVVDKKGEVRVFSQWSVGGGIGAFSGSGLTASFYPKATADQLMGGGINVGGSVGVPLLAGSSDLNGSLQTDKKGSIEDMKLGVTLGLKPGSLGTGGAEVHWDYSSATSLAEFNIKDKAPDFVINLLKENTILTSGQSAIAANALFSIFNMMKEMEDKNKKLAENQDKKPHVNNDDKDDKDKKKD